jgi:phage-related protein
VSQPIDTVYVDLEARGEEDAARDIERAARNMERYLDHATREMERDIQRMAKEITDSVTAGTDDAGKSFDRFSNEATKDLRRVGDEAEGVGRKISRSLGGGSGGGGAVGGGLLDSLSQLGAHLRNISALAPPPIFLALAAAIPAVLALGGAVADLTGLLLLLPAALGSIISVVAALKLAFTGVGGAIEALASGDLEKIRKAMKDLAPSARAFAREINALRKPLLQLRQAVQESFFKQIRGDITELATAALPTLRLGLARVASALGGFARQLFELLGANDILEAMGDVFAGTARIITGLTPKIIDLLGVLFGVAERGMPFLERAFAALGRGLDALTGFLSGSLKTGEFESFLENAFQIMSDLGGLAVAVFDLLGALFGNMGDEGSTFIQTLTDMTNALTNFFRSAEGQAILQRIVDILPIMLSLFQTGIMVLGVLALNTERTIRTLQWLGEQFMRLIGVVGAFFGNLGGWVSTAYTTTIGFFATLGSAISGIVSRVLGWVNTALAAIASFVGRMFAFVTNIDQVANMIGFIIGSIIRYFLNLRSLVNQAIQLLVAGAIALWLRLQQFLVSTTLRIVNSVATFFRNLPGAVGGALSRLWSTVSSWFSRTRSTASSATSSLVSQVVSFFRGLPGRVASAISSLPGRILSILRSIVGGARSVGSQIINGIISGIRGGFGAAVAAARRVAQGILSGMKSALGIGSPSKLAALEIGKPIMQGVGVGARDEARDLRADLNRAVVGTLPGITNVTNNSGDTNSGATVTLGPGAVQIVFQGAVPTQQEALRTGSAVAAGIAATLRQRTIRSEIRVI